MAHRARVPDWLLFQEEDGRAGSAAATSSGAQPDAAAHRGGH